MKSTRDHVVCRVSPSAEFFRAEQKDVHRVSSGRYPATDVAGNPAPASERREGLVVDDEKVDVGPLVRRSSCLRSKHHNEQGAESLKDGRAERLDHVGRQIANWFGPSQ